MTVPTSISGTRVEIVDPPSRRRPVHAVLDLDGTVSLLRDGWQDEMVPMMVDVLAECPRAESREELEAVVIDFVDHLTGKQTIYQMIRLGEEVEKRGGTPREPLVYKGWYNDRLGAKLADRHRGLADGTLDPDQFLLPGARDFLRALRERGVVCHIASGTDEEFVQHECGLLQVADFFDGGIHGALPNWTDFSKEKVIRSIIAEFDLGGPELLVVGDGFVEIQNAREVGATAYGLWSEERNRYHMNADKRDRLVRAGAHLLAPDLTDGAAVLDWLDATA